MIERSDELRPLVISPGVYEFFMAHGREGLDAMRVWLHLQYTSIRQDTRNVWAKDVYIKKGLEMGGDKVKRMKAWLRRHDLIDYKRTRNADGTLGETYIQVSGMPKTDATSGVETTPVDTTSGVDINPVDEPPGGEQATNAHRTIEMLTEQLEMLPAVPEKPAVKMPASPRDPVTAAMEEEIITRIGIPANFARHRKHQADLVKAIKRNVPDEELAVKYVHAFVGAFEHLTKLRARQKWWNVAVTANNMFQRFEETHRYIAEHSKEAAREPDKLFV